MKYLRAGVSLDQIDYLFFKDTFLADSYLGVVSMRSPTPRVFVEFEGSGHVSPGKGTEARKFFYAVIEKFLNRVADQESLRAP
jgi:hypothetical protein